MPLFSRRDFLAASGAICAAALTGAVQAQTVPPALAITRRTLDINGKAASVFGLIGPGGQGMVLNPDERFQVTLTNNLNEPAIIHWHGQIPPNAQDGIPNMPLPLMAQGESRMFDFVPRAGTHWMHSHLPEQEIGLLAAPLIVRRPQDITADRQEIVMMLHDFSFRKQYEPWFHTFHANGCE